MNEAKVPRAPFVLRFCAGTRAAGASAPVWPRASAARIEWTQGAQGARETSRGGGVSADWGLDEQWGPRCQEERRAIRLHPASPGTQCSDCAGEERSTSRSVRRYPGAC